MSEELKPCPFCGSDDIHESGDNGYGSFWVICEGCGVSTSEVGIANQAEANARWNTRSTPMAGAEPPKQGEATQVGELYAALEALLDAHQGGQVAPIEGADGYVSSLVERGEAAIANAPQAQQVAPLGIDDVFKATAANGETCHFGTERGATIWAGTGGKVERIALRSLSLVAAPSVEPALPEGHHCHSWGSTTWCAECGRDMTPQAGEQELPTTAPHQEPGWQPIETAPKDGRELILLLTPSRFPQVAYSNTWWTSGFSVECKPTHWMPLPAAPKEGQS